MKYEVAEHSHYLGQWHVESILEDGAIMVAIFTGPEANKRAREYADWKGSEMTDETIESGVVYPDPMPTKDQNDMTGGDYPRTAKEDADRNARIAADPWE